MLNRPNVQIPAAPNQLSDSSQIMASENAERARKAAATGLQGTTGTAGGEAGAILSPGTISNRSILGG